MKNNRNFRVRTFWERKAGHYPLPFERETAAHTARIVRLLESMGINFRGRSLLDIGCGTGIYGLFLAGTASRVLGVDSSLKMLARFRAEARSRKINNAACLFKDWASVRKLPGAPFDITLASMSGAVRTRADILRMERMSVEDCVYIGWAGERKNSFMGRIFAAHGLAYGTPDGGLEIANLLKRLGRKPKIKLITDNWIWSGTYKEALASAVGHLQVNNAPVRRQWLAKFTRARIRNGRISHKTSARKVLIAWKPPYNQQSSARRRATSAGVPSATSTSPLLISLERTGFIS